MSRLREEEQIIENAIRVMSNKDLLDTTLDMVAQASSDFSSEDDFLYEELYKKELYSRLTEWFGDNNYD